MCSVHGTALFAAERYESIFQGKCFLILGTAVLRNVGFTFFFVYADVSAYDLAWDLAGTNRWHPLHRCRLHKPKLLLISCMYIHSRSRVACVVVSGLRTTW